MILCIILYNKGCVIVFSLKEIIFITFSWILSICVYLLVLFMQPQVDLSAHRNASTVVFAVFLFIFWMCICINMDVFSSVVYTFKKFFRKEKSESYFEYTQNKKKIEKYIWLNLLIIAIGYSLILISLYIFN